MSSARLFQVIIVSMLTFRVLGQTNNETPQAKYSHEKFKTATWGIATNGIQFGACVSAISPSTIAQLRIFTFLNNANSTTTYGLWKLPQGYRFETLTLKSKEGEEMERTRKGDALCKSPLLFLSDGETVVLDPGVPQDYDEQFSLRDCFKIKKAGVYILTVKARLYSMKSYNTFLKLDIPETRLEFVLHASELEE